MNTSVVKEAPHQKIVTFKELIPGITSILRRLPSFVKTIRTVLTIPDKKGLSLGSVLEENAVKFKNHTALVFEEKSWTYEAFNKEVNRFADFFLSPIGIGRQPGANGTANDRRADRDHGNEYPQADD